MWRIAIPKTIDRIYHPENDKWHAYVEYVVQNPSGRVSSYYIYYDREQQRFGRHTTRRVLRKNGPMRFVLPYEYWLSDDPEQLLEQARIYLRRLEDEVGVDTEDT